jgi:hypothetical protein
MKSCIPEKIRGRWSWLLVIGLLLPALLSTAFATLGAARDSVQDDQFHLQAKIRVTAAQGYSIHELTAPTGTVVREYVSPNGYVFGVGWQGPFVPNMQILLGAYFEQYARQVKSQRERYVGHLPLNIQEPTLVVQTAGHMRAYFGRAYVPGLLPAGVSAHDIQ